MRQWTGHGVSKVGVTLKGTPPWAPSSDGGGRLVPSRPRTEALDGNGISPEPPLGWFCFQHAAELQGGPFSAGSGSVSLTCVSNKFPGPMLLVGSGDHTLRTTRWKGRLEGQECPQSDPPRPPRSTFQVGHSVAAWGHLYAQGQRSGLCWPHKPEHR